MCMCVHVCMCEGSCVGELSFSPSESRAVTITTFSKDRVQDQVSETNSAADEFVTRQETQYFTQVCCLESSWLSWKFYNSVRASCV